MHSCYCLRYILPLEKRGVEDLVYGLLLCLFVLCFVFCVMVLCVDCGVQDRLADGVASVSKGSNGKTLVSFASLVERVEEARSVGSLSLSVSLSLSLSLSPSILLSERTNL